AFTSTYRNPWFFNSFSVCSVRGTAAWMLSLCSFFIGVIYGSASHPSAVLASFLPFVYCSIALLAIRDAGRVFTPRSIRFPGPLSLRIGGPLYLPVLVVPDEERQPNGPGKPH